MARQESEREDLLAEATALVERAELLTLADGTHVVAGFRHDGAASVYFGDEPVYQFNADGQLRRAFYRGQIIKAERGQLVALDRVRTNAATQLVRQPWTQGQTRQFLQELDERLGELAQRMRERRFQLVGQYPADTDVVGQIERWLDQRPETCVADSPRASR